MQCSEHKMYNIRFRAECLPKSSYSTGYVKIKTQKVISLTKIVNITFIHYL